MNVFSSSSSYLRGFVLIIMIAGTVLTPPVQAGGPTVPGNRFTNMGSIANTRHNMTQSTAPAIVVVMNGSRNDYGEVCVYCHTPHGANTTIAAPLWNRTVKPTTYTIYGNSGTLTQTISQPGGSSLSCLSCHDGQTAIDSIINMPGSGLYNANQQTTQDTTFLNSWPVGCVGFGCGPTHHQGLNSDNGVQGNGTGKDGIGCLICHDDGLGLYPSGLGPNFTVALIGTDLTNDHPVGITFPTTNGPGTGFNTPIAQGAMRYFDVNANGAMDKGDVRLYGPGIGGATGAASATVECASCHDPHGVPSAGPGSVFNPTFLRRSNNGSALCLTCHIKSVVSQR